MTDNLVTACSDCNIGKGEHVLKAMPPSIPDSVTEHFFSYTKDSSLANQVVQFPYYKLPQWDREVVAVLLSVPEAVGLVVREVDSSELESEEGRQVLAAAKRLYDDGRQVGISSLLLEILEPAMQSMLVAVDEATAARGPVDPRKYIDNLQDALRRRSARRQAHEKAQELKSCRLGPESEAVLLEHLVALRRAAQGMDKKEG